jgi:hypothetical protein
MARDSIISGITQKDPKMMTSEDNTIPLNDIAPTTIPQLNNDREDTKEGLVENDITEVTKEEATETSLHEKTTAQVELKNATSMLPDKGMLPQWNFEHPCIKTVEAAMTNMKVIPQLKWGESTKGYEIKGRLKVKWGVKKPTKKRGPTSK